MVAPRKVCCCCCERPLFSASNRPRKRAGERAASERRSCYGPDLASVAVILGLRTERQDVRAERARPAHAGGGRGGLARAHAPADSLTSGGPRERAHFRSAEEGGKGRGRRRFKGPPGTTSPLARSSIKSGVYGRCPLLLVCECARVWGVESPVRVCVSACLHIDCQLARDYLRTYITSTRSVV